MPNEPLQEDWLDARLREEAPYIDDAGFTARVVAQLPAHAPRRSFRGLILLCITLLASALTYTISHGGAFVIDAASNLERMPLWLLAIVACLCTVLVSAVATAAVFARTREEILP